MNVLVPRVSRTSSLRCSQQQRVAYRKSVGLLFRESLHRLKLLRLEEHHLFLWAPEAEDLPGVMPTGAIPWVI